MKRIDILAALVVLLGLDGVHEARSQHPPAEKPYVTRMLVANVWPSGYSELWWLDSPKPIHVITNIDVNVFGPGLFLERSEALYDFFIIGSTFTEEDVRQGQLDGSVDARGVPRAWPRQLPPRGGPAQFVAFSSGEAASAGASDDWRICDLLHRYYQANRIQIEAQARQREIDAAKATANDAARRALIPPHYGPPVIFKRIEDPVPARIPTRP